MRSGGKRKDRIFKVYITLPDGVSEDEIMDYIEDAVCEYKKYEPPRRAHNFNSDFVSVKRLTPVYGGPL